MASTVGGQATDNTEIINGNAIGIQRAIKSKIRYKSDPSGHVINLSKHSFSLDTFKLLNKNLNFVPTSEKYNKKQLDNDAENFFRLIKLRAHFKDINPKSNTDQEDLPFQIKISKNGHLRTPTTA